MDAPIIDEAEIVQLPKAKTFWSSFRSRLSSVSAADPSLQGTVRFPDKEVDLNKSIASASSKTSLHQDP